MRSRKRTASVQEAQIHQKYAEVLAAVKGGSNVMKACAAVPIPRATFYKWRYHAELKIVDPALYNLLVEQKETKKCRTILLGADNTLKRMITEKRREGELLAKF